MIGVDGAIDEWPQRRLRVSIARKDLSEPSEEELMSDMLFYPAGADLGSAPIKTVAEDESQAQQTANKRACAPERQLCPIGGSCR